MVLNLCRLWRDAEYLFPVPCPLSRDGSVSLEAPIDDLLLVRLLCMSTLRTHIALLSWLRSEGDDKLYISEIKSCPRSVLALVSSEKSLSSLPLIPSTCAKLSVLWALELKPPVLFTPMPFRLLLSLSLTVFMLKPCSPTAALLLLIVAGKETGIAPMSRDWFKEIFDDVLPIVVYFRLVEWRFPGPMLLLCMSYQQWSESVKIKVYEAIGERYR